ncbi:MAG: hypothetical protein H0T42_22230 [Deltaproteobacteria bacterium]|nr:hypothetical protein [Deltaproteobacteria bacterium]
MKTILLLTAVAALASPAFAGKPRSTTPSTSKRAVIGAIKKAPEAPMPKMNFGESYILGARTSAEPTSSEPTHDAKSVSDSQVGQVVRDRVEELEYCWLRLPASKRVATSATLHLAIEASGAVAGVTVDGVLPAGMSKCITAAASKWTFPSADSGCEIEHGISMGMKSDTVR